MFRNLNNQLSDAKRSGVYMLWSAGSHHPPPWWEACIPIEVTDMYQIVMHIPEPGPGQVPLAALLFLSASSHFSNY